GERLISVDLPDCLLNRASQEARIPACPDQQVVADHRALDIADIHAGVAVLQAADFFVRHNADDLPRNFRPQLVSAGDDLLDQDLLADRLFVLEVALNHSLVYYRRGKRTHGVGFRQATSAAELYAERFEI